LVQLLIEKVHSLRLPHAVRRVPHAKFIRFCWQSRAHGHIIIPVMTKSAKLGQNFLRDEGVARRIADLVPAGDGPLLEIGPGGGILTRLLRERFPRRPLTLVEVDSGLAGQLLGEFGARARVLNRDILEVDLRGLFPGGRVTVAGNLPYHISKPLIDWFIAQRPDIAAAALMLQKDFVDKLLAAPGGKKYNAQSVVFQLLFRSRRVFDVPPGAFSPRPKVVSTVIMSEPAEPPAKDVEGFYGFVRQCFAERRKTLANNLAGRFPAAALAAALAAAGADAQARAEQLSAHAFQQLFLALSAGTVF
jgi:16S rRNA (adenine1518-N6/adenine1519-N6)-dimethyltransferase